MPAIADVLHHYIASTFRRSRRKLGPISCVDASKIICDITEVIRDITEQAPAAIAVFDEKMRYLAVSRRFVSDFQLSSPAEVIGRSLYEIFPDIPPGWREIHARVLAGEELAHDEDSFPRQDGHTDWVRWSMTPWRGADGRIGGALLFNELITEQSEARRALADSEARFRATFENAAVGIANVAPNGRWLGSTKPYGHILGLLHQEATRANRDRVHT